MEQESGDDYIRRLASFIRTNEKRLAEAGFIRRRRSLHPATDTSTMSYLNPLGWFVGSAPTSTPPLKPVILNIDTPRLFYILMRLEAIGLDVGTLDVEVENPSRPTSYINIRPSPDNSDAISLASIRSSLSTMSSLSLGGGWWSRSEILSIDAELKYLFSSFTKLPALSVNAPGKKLIQELAHEPNRNALPMDVFRNLQSLECVDIDPRILLGWDRLAESLRSLKIRKSGVEDMTDIFIGAVVDDQARRQGSTSRQRRRRIPRGLSKEPSIYATRLPDSVPEDEDGELATIIDSSPTSASPPPSTKLSSLKWAFLKHLSLADNSLTFFPVESIPYLTSLTHLDLSSNLFVSVPPGLASLYNLVFLDLSDNMIDSVLGIYTTLGQVLRINLSRNRLETICGLERLHALEYVDLRNNLVEDVAEVSRLATLPNIAEVCIEGNPFVEIDENHRVKCFDYFWKEGKTILLDGTPPGFYEKRNLTSPPPAQMTSSRSAPTAPTPPVVAVTHNHEHEIPSPGLQASSTSSASNHASPHFAPVSAVGVHGRSRKKKVKRIVDLDGENSDAASSSRSPSHSRMRSELSTKVGTSIRMREHGPQKGQDEVPPSHYIAEPVSPPGGGELAATLSSSPLTSNPLSASPERGSIVLPRTQPLSPLPSRSNGYVRPRHNRYQTEYAPHSASFETTTLPSGLASTSAALIDALPNVSPPSLQRNAASSATTASRSSLRRARVSASVYEPGPPPGKQAEELNTDQFRYDAEAYRKRIEALKKDMGDAWLKVYSQRI